MKKSLCLVCLFIAVFWISCFVGPKNTVAGEMQIPQHILQEHEAQGTKIANFVWFPFVPSNFSAQFPWETFIFLSNWTAQNITVNAWATDFGGDPTIKSIALALQRNIN
ncbi:MAG: hypothetical protein U5L00_13530 [Desulfovermiculus sp.]|nr:hypothetical protein [Desulfovermiculus sp.]